MAVGQKRLQVAFGRWEDKHFALGSRHRKPAQIRTALGIREPRCLFHYIQWRSAMICPCSLPTKHRSLTKFNRVLYKLVLLQKLWRSYPNTSGNTWCQAEWSVQAHHLSHLHHPQRLHTSADACGQSKLLAPRAKRTNIRHHSRAKN